MFSKTAFHKSANDSVILFASVMTKIEGRPYDDLLRTYEYRGFPSMAILDADGAKQYEGFPRDVYGMTTILGSVGDYLSMQAEIDAGKEVDAKAWFLARLYMGEVDLSTAGDELAKHELSDAERARAEGHLFALEMADLMNKNYEFMRANGRGSGNDPEVVAAIYDAFVEGKRLPAGTSAEEFVADVLVETGYEQKNAAAFHYGFERVLPSLEGQIADMRGRIEDYSEKAKTDERYANAIKSMEGRIASHEKRIALLRERAAEMK